MNHPKNQHYVPQFILRNFTHNGTHLYCFDKKTGKRFSPNTQNVASEMYFYDLENGVPEYSFEYQLTDLETKVAPIIEHVVKERTIRNLSEDQRRAISLYTAVQMLRTPHSREDILHVNREMARILRENGAVPNDVTNFREIETEQEAKEITLYNLRIASEMVPEIMNKKWLLCVSDEKFLISDNPVVRQNTRNKSSVRGTLGLKNQGIEIYFPLSPSVLLSFICADTIADIELAYSANGSQAEMQGDYSLRNFLFSVRRKLPIVYSESNIENVNSLQVIFSERFVFSKDPDFDLAIDMVSKDDRLKMGIRSRIS